MTADPNSPVALYAMGKAFQRGSREPGLPRMHLRSMARKAWDAARAHDPMVAQVPLTKPPMAANLDQYWSQWEGSEVEQDE